MKDSIVVVDKKDPVIEVAVNVKKEEPSIQPSIKQTTTQSAKTVHQYGTSPLTQLELSLENYRNNITKSVTPEELSKTQLGLLRLLRSILNNTNQEEVNLKWTAVLNFANKHKDTAFNERNMFKGAASWTGSIAEFNALRHLNWLIIQSADPKTRKSSVRMLSLDKILTNLNQAERNSLINYYA